MWKEFALVYRAHFYGKTSAEGGKDDIKEEEKEEEEKEEEEGYVKGNFAITHCSFACLSQCLMTIGTISLKILNYNTYYLAHKYKDTSQNNLFFTF